MTPSDGIVPDGRYVRLVAHMIDGFQVPTFSGDAERGWMSHALAKMGSRRPVNSCDLRPLILLC